MVVVNLGEEAKGIELRGALGRPNGVGEFWCGWSVLGDDTEFVGYFQRRPRKTGQIIVRMRHYISPNPQTSGQQLWRAVFAEGVEAWHALTAGERLTYNRLKYPARQSGFTRFMSRYLAQHYPPG